MPRKPTTSNATPITRVRATTEQAQKPDQAPPAGLLKEQAYVALKDRLVDGRYPPGTFLSERLLVANFGMSKTPIRFALERLEAEGFVTISPRRGIVVREPSVQEIADQFALRFAIERYVVESLAGRLTAEQVRCLRSQVQEQQKAAEADDLATYIRLDGDFHILFCEFLGNREILRAMSRIRERMTLVIALVFRQSAARKGPSWQEHRAIAEAVIEGNVAAAVARLREHLDIGQRMLVSRP
jgi:DNA-binding GntR family transcriptional regulator